MFLDLTKSFNEILAHIILINKIHHMNYIPLPLHIYFYFLVVSAIKLTKYSTKYEYVSHKHFKKPHEIVP